MYNLGNPDVHVATLIRHCCGTASHTVPKLETALQGKMWRTVCDRIPATIHVVAPTRELLDFTLSCLQTCALPSGQHFRLQALTAH